MESIARALDKHDKEAEARGRLAGLEEAVKVSRNHICNFNKNEVNNCSCKNSIATELEKLNAHNKS